MRIFSSALVELFGTAMLVCGIVGSGMMGDALSDDNGISLLIAAGSTALVLGLLIVLLGPASGAHFNPAISIAQMIRRQLSIGRGIVYLVAQCAGGVLGAFLANEMFGHAVIEFATTDRVNTGNLIGEVVATAGLVVVVIAVGARGSWGVSAAAVAAWIGSAHFFTASSSFANPAVTLGRMFTESFAGIAPQAVLPFVGAQLVGMLLGLGLGIGLLAAERLNSPAKRPVKRSAKPTRRASA